MSPASDPQADYGNYPGFISYFSAPRTETYPYIATHHDDLSGRSVFITGASQGIGRLLAVTFARAGCSSIAISSRTQGGLDGISEEIINAALGVSLPKPKVIPVLLDLTSEASVQAAVHDVKEGVEGKLDFLINNASTLETHNFVQESDPIDWWQTWEVNTRGAYLVTKHLLPSILASEMKTVVNLTSGMALMVVQGYSAYCPSKVATCRFTEFLASEYAEQGLVTMALEPGLTATKLATELHPILRDLPKDDPRLTPETIVWLVREQRPWLSGRIVSARWDMEEVIKRKNEIVEKDLFKFKVSLF